MRSNKDREFEPEINEEEFKPEVKSERPKKYIITVNNLAIRMGPGFDYERVDIAGEGRTLISEVKDGWGKLADNRGWVNMDYVRKAD